MADLGKAYVQIVPSAKGISGSISNVLNAEATSSGESAGKKIGSGLATKLKAVIAGAGITTAITKLISSAVTAGAELEQSIGGVETLFGSSAETVINNAAKAYKTAGLSANEYMETVTSFAAALKQSTKTEAEAAEAADQAVIDMSDNANKMGTSMEDIQNAYQGFAKQNYTMLDNLKLGYGGTKEEMERLLEDAEKLSGQEYDISNLSDVYEAIHVIQEDLGITGTTSEEAAETISGSFAAMKSAATNLLGNLALGENVSTSFGELLSSVKTFLAGNLLPMIGTIFVSIGKLLIEKIPELYEKIVDGLDSLIEKIENWDVSGAATTGENMMDKIAEGLKNYLPKILKAIGTIILKLVAAFLKALPKLLKVGIQLLAKLASGMLGAVSKITKAAASLIKDLLAKLLSYPAKFIKAGKEWILGIVDGLTNNVKKITKAAASLVKDFVEKLLSYPAKLIKAGKEWILGIVDGLTNNIEKITSVPKDIFKAFKEKILEKNWPGIGKDIIQGIVDGLKEKVANIGSTIGDIADSIISGFKDALGISSPSKVFAEAASWIPEGIAEGIESNAGEAYGAASALAAGTASSYRPVMADSIVSGISTLAAAGSYGGSTSPVSITLYAYPNGAKMDEAIVDCYDRGKRRLG